MFEALPGFIDIHSNTASSQDSANLFAINKSAFFIQVAHSGQFEATEAK